MWIYIWTSEPKSIYVWTTPVKEVYVWTTKVRPKARTFTITWTEQSDMSSWWTYSDDAAWLTAWSWDFDDFFWYSAVLLNTSGIETAEMTQSWGVFTWAMTTLGNITSWDNVMIKFPARWIKMTKSWSVVTLSITDDLTKESEWYQYYAFQTWTLASPWTIKDKFYLGAYKWFNSSVLKSWSWRTPLWAVTQANLCTYAKANGSWYNISGFYQRQYINALYMMKYGNPNSQTVVWKWFTAWNSASKTTWWTDSYTNATWGETAGKTQMKLFWIEDYWGNISEFVWWAYTDASRYLCTQLSWWSWAISWWQSTWTKMTASGCISGVVGDNKSMFAPATSVNNTNYNTYYTDGTATNYSCLLLAGGYWSENVMAGVFRIGITTNASYSNAIVWARLMYL